MIDKLTEGDDSGESERDVPLMKSRSRGGKVRRPIASESEEEHVDNARAKRKRETVTFRTPSPSGKVDTGKSFVFLTLQRSAQILFF